MVEKSEEDWKLKLRYGKISTPYEHYTLITDGHILDANKCGVERGGSAFMSMKVWASSSR